MTVCARPGCRKPVPRTALLAGDGFCSAACARVVFGVPDRADPKPQPEKARRRGKAA